MPSAVAVARVWRPDGGSPAGTKVKGVRVGAAVGAVVAVGVGLDAVVGAGAVGGIEPAAGEAVGPGDAAGAAQAATRLAIRSSRADPRMAGNGAGSREVLEP
jgi:hypothetical protein